MSDSEKLKDVWKWKESVYEKTKSMTPEERIGYYNTAAAELSRIAGLKINVKKSDRNVPV